MDIKSNNFVNTPIHHTRPAQAAYRPISVIGVNKSTISTNQQSNNKNYSQIFNLCDQSIEFYNDPDDTSPNQTIKEKRNLDVSVEIKARDRNY